MKKCRSVAWACVIAGSGMASVVNAADGVPMPVKAAAVSADRVWTTTVSLDVRYSTWRSTFGFPNTAPPVSGNGRGSQLYMPFGITTVGSPVPDWKFEFIARSGYVSSKQTTDGMSGSVSTLTDTTLGGTATYTGIAGFVPYLSLNINAPTGKAGLYGDARFARMDPDLVDVPTFGEGWNIGPTVGANIPITESLVFNASVGYTQRNPFNREGAFAFDPVTTAIVGQASSRLDPGDVVTLSAGLTYSSGPWSAQAAIAYATEGTSSVDGAPQYRAGDRYTLSANGAYVWSPSWTTSVSGYVSWSDRNELFNLAINAFEREAFNSNNLVYRIGIDQTWTDGVWSLGPTVSYLKREVNAYNPVTFQFIPAKTRWSAGLVAGRTMSESFSLNARVERIWAYERDQPAFGTPNLTSDAWLFTGGAVYRF